MLADLLVSDPDAALGPHLVDAVLRAIPVDGPLLREDAVAVLRFFVEREQGRAGTSPGAP